MTLFSKSQTQNNTQLFMGSIQSVLLTQSQTDELYKICALADEVFKRNNIDYFLFSGSLLGAVRQDSIIPWDNDLDMVIFESDLPRFISLQPEFEKHGTYINYSDHIYRLDSRKGVWADIYVFSLEKTMACHHVEQVNRKRWPKEYFFTKEIYPLRGRRFGDLIVNTPNNSEEILERIYGEDWEIPVDYNRNKKYADGVFDNAKNKILDSMRKLTQKLGR